MVSYFYYTFVNLNFVAHYYCLLVFFKVIMSPNSTPGCNVIINKLSILLSLMPHYCLEEGMVVAGID